MSWVDEVLKVAKAEIGTTEWPSGSNKVKYNTWYYGQGVSGAAYPWCMAFAQWVFAHAGYTLPYKTASCSALLNWYKANKPGCVADKPVRGAIVIYTFGHTGIVDEVNADGSFYAVEGNTSSNLAGSQSNGGGVFRPLRYMTQVTKFIVPFEIQEEKGEDDMTGEEILAKIPMDKLIAKIQAFLVAQPMPAWVGEQGEFAEAVARGITDGSDPTRLMTRYEGAIMNLRTLKKARGE